MTILGISAFYHDSAAAIVRDGEIIAAAQEERFSRKKHDAALPVEAIRYCLSEAGVTGSGLDAVAFYDKPLLKFSRLLQTYFSVAPRGLNSFLTSIPGWMKQKLWIPLQIEAALEKLGVKPPQIFFLEHHQSHAASAFYPSPFQEAAILTIDGVGEWATSALGMGRDNRLEILKELHFPHSLGLLYSAFTYYTGFKVNSGEYKLMGLAPYGEPRYVDVIYENLIDLREDGSFRMNMESFDYLHGLTMTNKRFDRLFGGPPRQPEQEITPREMDIARSIQVVTEEIVLRMARHTHDVTGAENLCMAGGVALNCVATGRLLREGPFKNVWLQPAGGDAGGALGAALMAWHQIHDNPRSADGTHDTMRGAYLGPHFSNDQIQDFLQTNNYPARRLNEHEWAHTLAQLIDGGAVIGLFAGRMEFGPRALGARSIIGDARSPRMQSIMNLKIKHRESFRPFAPACLEERGAEYFELDRPSPYMLLTAYVQKHRRTPRKSDTLSLQQQINEVRSDIPAVTHVDYSARVQTVDAHSHPRFYQLIKAFEELTGYGIIINTSFNVRGEPIVCTPEDAYRCFMRTGMDYLVLEDFLLDKREQPAWSEPINRETDSILD